MIKHYHYEFENGLKLVVTSDETKKVNRAEVIVNFGGSIKKIKIDNKYKEIDFGIAHALEHTIIEKSEFGNAVNYMSDLFTSCNGYTNRFHMGFYIQTVLDFYDRFKDLLVVILNPNIKDIEDLKQPIIEEIRQANTKSLKEFYLISESQLYKTPYNNTLGSEEAILKLTSKELKEIYNIFFQPNNMVINVSGNIDGEKIKDIINEMFNKYKRKSISYKVVPRKKEPIISKKETVYKNDTDELTRITFTFDRALFTNEEVRRLCDYIHFMYYESFSDASGMYDYLVQNKISLFSAGYGMDLNDLNVILYLELWTNQTDITEEIAIDKFNKFKFDPERFKLWINNKLLDVLIASTHVHTLSSNYINNILDLDIYEIDDIDYYKSLNIEEARELYSRLIFNNYIITELRHTNENN